MLFFTTAQTLVFTKFGTADVQTQQNKNDQINVWFSQQYVNHGQLKTGKVINQLRSDVSVPN